MLYQLLGPLFFLVPPPPQGLPGQCNRHRCEWEGHRPLIGQEELLARYGCPTSRQCKRHRCEREGQSLLFLQRPPPTDRSRRAPCQMRLPDFSSVQAEHVRTGRAVSAIRSTTTAHSLVKKSSLSDAACLCRQITMTGVAPSPWAIVRLVPPPPHGVNGQCNRHECGRERQSLLFAQRPPPTH